MGMEHTFASATILLLLITDPLGNIPIFVNSLRAVPPERRARVIVREVLIAFGLLLTFMFVGQSFLKAMSLSDVSLQIGGAVVLFLIALRMIFPPPPQDSPVPVADSSLGRTFGHGHGVAVGQSSARKAHGVGRCAHGDHAGLRRGAAAG
jgi:small neutral amino acid transporter SnatA (MarC family)